MACGAQNL
jgi:hypothetical protein